MKPTWVRMNPYGAPMPGELVSNLASQPSRGLDLADLWLLSSLA